uniref:MULE transposase domain-containing protein n=1 Tax=Lactuca sativa TaxID=4236 RepID=A0A9R1WR58_LACSA|nr:hypothetical protein LSAT_V11C900467900 [Lactuca sativa]
MNGGKIENGEPWTWLLSKLYRAINEFENLRSHHPNLELRAQSKSYVRLSITYRLPNVSKAFEISLIFYNFLSGESSSLVDDVQYCSNIIREHVYKLYVSVKFTPLKGLIFKSLELAIKMYYEYAEIGGFDVRLSIQTRFDNKIIIRNMLYLIVVANKKRNLVTHWFNCQDDVLDTMFWVDEMEKAYYGEFGDVISFDVTLRTNKYQMVFVPFTVIDYHKKSIIVGAGLLCNENIESYSWLLKAFLKTYGKEPTLVLTDQDAIIKQVIKNISDDLFMNINFRKRFLKLVWDMNMKPDVFEVKCGLLMKEFNLEDTRWFKDMFT